MVQLMVDGVEFYYESSKILDQLSFSVSGGEFVGLLGPNGAGKTTLLRIISKTLKPLKGVVLLDELNIAQMKVEDIAKKVGVVPQDSSTPFDFTVLEIVLMGRNPYLGRIEMETAEDLSIVRQAMELTNTWQFADRRVGEVSGGERRRVIIARALAQSPQVLLLDEPTLHLDINSQIEIMDLLEKLCKQNKLIVISVLHDFNLAARYCDKILLLSSRKILSLGRPEEVLTPENIRAAFRVEVLVKHHPATGSIYVVPLSATKPKESEGKKGRIHLICGGGSGSYAMAAFLDQGWSVTAGVVNVLDADYEAAEMLHIPTVSEAPFSPITEEAFNENLRLIQDADALILTDFPVGRGNLKNLQAAMVATEKGIPTIVIEATSFGERDFTGGEAQRLLDEMIKKGAVVVKTLGEAVKELVRRSCSS